MSVEYFLKYFIAFYLTYLSQLNRDGIGTFLLSRLGNKERLSRLQWAITLSLSW